MELMRGLAFIALLFAGSAVGAELRQAEVCTDGTTHQAGYCPAVLSSASCSATGATTGSCSATSDEADGTRYVCATSSVTALTGAQIEACSGGAAIAGSSAAETGSNSVSLSGLTTDAAHYGQIVNESPEGWYSNRLVSASFTPTEPASGDNATRISDELNGRSAGFAYNEPLDPVTTTTINVTANSFASLQSAVSTSGALVNVPAGTYTGNLDFDASDVDVVMDSGATVVGNVTFGVGPSGAAGRTERVRWTGGNQSGGFITLNHFRDLMVDNVYFTTSGGDLNQMSGGSNGTDDGWQRVAFLNSTIDHQSTDAAGGWAWYTEGYSGATQADLFLMNVKFMTNGGQNNRFQSITRMVVVDSAFNPDFNSANGFRTGPGGNGPCTNLYFDNVVVSEGWLMNYTGAQNVSNGTFSRVYRYHVGSFFNFADMVGSNTGTISNSAAFGSSGTPPGSLSVSPFTNGGGNTVGNHAYLGSGVPSLPDSTLMTAVGAVR